MRILLFLVLALCSCKDYKPPVKTCVAGVYSGEDSALNVYDKYGAKMFGKCVKIQKNEDGTHYFLDKQLEQIGEDIFKFDYITRTDFGVGLDSDIHFIRRTGTLTFNSNRVEIEYSVGDTCSQMSHFKFSGWR
jgi:hypothetical protein